MKPVQNATEKLPLKEHQIEDDDHCGTQGPESSSKQKAPSKVPQETADTPNTISSVFSLSSRTTSTNSQSPPKHITAESLFGCLSDSDSECEDHQQTYHCSRSISQAKDIPAPFWRPSDKTQSYHHDGTLTQAEEISARWSWVCAWLQWDGIQPTGNLETWSKPRHPIPAIRHDCRSMQGNPPTDRKKKKKPL